MILKVLIIFDPKLNLFKSDAYIFMQQSRTTTKITMPVSLKMAPTISMSM